MNDEANVLIQICPVRAKNIESLESQPLEQVEKYIFNLNDTILMS